MDELDRALWCAAGALVGVLLFTLEAPRASARWLLGLQAGALLAYLGSDLALMGRLPRFESASVLFVPLGVLIVAPWREALAALPLALGLARLGCLPYHCCYPSPWNAVPELVGWVALHFLARRWPRHTTPIVLCGFGAIRLLSLPLRRVLATEPFIDPAWIAVAWIAAGVLLRHRIGSAADAREWFTARTEPLLRALALMLVVWLLFPLGGELFGDPSHALLVASLAAVILLVASRPASLRVSLASTFVCGAALLVGLSLATLASAAPFAIGGLRIADARMAFALVAVAPVFEEILYRERLLGALRSLWGAPAALLASSALFALSHPDPRVMPVAFAGGLVCGLVMLRTGSLAAVIGLHAGWNLGVVT